MLRLGFMVLNRRTVTAGLLIGVFLSSIDSTVVATAMPSVIGELRGVALYGWVISAYLFAFTVATPIAGRLGDSLGRRPVYLFGSMGFMVASALSGFSTSIEMLIACRALQGVAGGTLFAMTATLLGDLYPLEERGKVQALSSAVWGVSSIMGPLVGGLFVQIDAWRWIFFLNLPFGALSIAIFMKSYRDRERTRVRTDWVGAALFSGTVLAALFALPHANGASVTWAWREAAMLVLAAILGIGFAFNMKRGHPSPFIPFRLFRSRVVAIASLSGALAAGVMYSALTFLPLFVQAAMGEPAMVAGMVDVGEQTGALPEMLTKIADRCDEDGDNATTALTSLLEPGMRVFLAIIVGSIVIAMFLPLLGILETGFDREELAGN